ncbi:MAG: hypothetical protein E7541_03105 [Ruminococcaceae bacterium]|nr:hypothetical protein [Oscillospiraceae bacterium]
MRTTTFGIGELMNVIMGSTMIVTMWLGCRLAGRLFKKSDDSSVIYYVSAIATVAMTILVGWLTNAALTPVFFTLAGIPITAEAVLAGVWGSTLLNAIKSAVTILPFWPLIHVINQVFKRFS